MRPDSSTNKFITQITQLIFNTNILCVIFLKRERDQTE